MSNYLGESFTRAIERAIVVGVVLLILLIVGVFFLGRCTAQHNVKFQSPITVQESPR